MPGASFPKYCVAQKVHVYFDPLIRGDIARQNGHGLFCSFLMVQVYTDPAFAKMEREKVFKRSWVAIDHRSQHLAEHGDVLSTMIGDIPILITNNHGELRGFYNVCRHRGSILLKEGKYTKCTVIRCPYHSWGYSCNGKLAGAPYFNDDRMPLNAQQKKDKSQVNELTAFSKINFNKEQYGLFEIGVREFMGTLFVNLDDDKGTNPLI